MALCSVFQALSALRIVATIEEALEVDVKRHH